MWISKYVCLFMIYSCIGWVYESIYCAVKYGKWHIRGFLYGPACPIYGIGAIGISAVAKLALKNGIALSLWQVFLISVIGSAILEYVTSWTLEKLFHALWWDYSNRPFNVNGRISLFTSIGFGIGGVLIVYVIAPFMETAVNCIPPIILELLSLCFVFIFAADFTLTVTALHHFDQMVMHMEEMFNHRMETLVDSTVQQSAKVKESLLNNGYLLNEKMDLINDFVKDTIRRIISFKDTSKQRESVKNSLLKKIKEITKQES